MYTPFSIYLSKRFASVTFDSARSTFHVVEIIRLQEENVKLPLLFKKTSLNYYEISEPVPSFDILYKVCELL